MHLESLATDCHQYYSLYSPLRLSLQSEHSGLFPTGADSSFSWVFVCALGPNSGKELL